MKTKRTFGDGIDRVTGSTLKPIKFITKQLSMVQNIQKKGFCWSSTQLDGLTWPSGHRHLQGNQLTVPKIANYDYVYFQPAAEIKRLSFVYSTHRECFLLFRAVTPAQNKNKGFQSFL